MRKRMFLLLVLAIAILSEAFLILHNERTVFFSIDGEEKLCLSVKCGRENLNIYPYYDEKSDISYFFLPAFVNNNNIYCDIQDYSDLVIDGEQINRRTKFVWEANVSYEVNNSKSSHTIQFMKSKNLPTIFVDTASGNLDYLNMDKKNKETGHLTVVQNSGNLEFEGEIEISERGNSTFGVSKKSFSLKLNKKQPLCGIEAGKKWNLLSLFYEHNKIQSKLVYDMASYLNMNYSPQCTWVDVYCNGEYEGLYLLTEATTVEPGRVDIYDLQDANERANADINVETLEATFESERAYYDIVSPLDISGGYLLEKTPRDRLEESGAYFITEMGMAFSIKEPQTASEDEVAYISNLVQNVENLILENNVNYKQYIDEESFAKQYLIDKLVLEADAMTASTFFYVDKGSNILVSGPLWDYDRAMGLSLHDYSSAVEEGLGEMQCWYKSLYEDEEFKNIMIQNYMQLLPYIECLLAGKIDEYVEYINESLKMDKIRHPYTGANTMMYFSYESYIKYLKYFLAKRVEFLNEEWGILYELDEYATIPSEREHKVILMQNDGSIWDTISVKDGECIYGLPKEYRGNDINWFFYGSNKMYDKKVPIFEDLMLISR